jgi:hypothetical protein
VLLAAVDRRVDQLVENPRIDRRAVSGDVARHRPATPFVMSYDAPVFIVAVA